MKRAIVSRRTRISEYVEKETRFKYYKRQTIMRETQDVFVLSCGHIVNVSAANENLKSKITSCWKCDREA